MRIPKSGLAIARDDVTESEGFFPLSYDVLEESGLTLKTSWFGSDCKP